jgi:oxygen-independent coproporphyrinogen-3 oxidase
MEAGFEHYEVSNFAKSGKKSIHNMNYWQGGNYIGLGVGAHSHLDGKRWWNVERLREYMGRIKSGASAEEGSEILTQEQRLSEALVFGLRMMDGVDLNVLEEQYGINIGKDRHRKIQEFSEKKFLSLENNILRATADGILVLDEISAFLV